MKRGFIGWDKEHLPPAALEARLLDLRRLISERSVQALVAFSDVWRSNDVRYISNYMPYWNRAFAVVCPEENPILLCALSPRVYPWIRSVTIHETIIPSPNLVAQLMKLCSERGWKRLGVLDHAGLPYDLYDQLAAQELEIVDIPRLLVRPRASAAEVVLHRRAARLARAILESEIGNAGVGMTDYEFTARLERSLRRAGAEDVVVLISNGRSPPAPAAGNVFDGRSSATVALECNGHWAKVSRNLAGLTSPLPPERGGEVHLESLSGGCAWEEIAGGEAAPGAIVSLQVEMSSDGNRLYYGDTGVQERGTVEIL
jgi:hypothetical protein